jgi:hypothetical protein
MDGHVVHMAEMVNAHTALAVKPEGYLDAVWETYT